MFQYEINYNNKKVIFAHLIDIIYIPRKEATKDIKEILWWNESDRKKAVNNTYFELNQLMRHHPIMTVKQAKKLLYQPNNITIYDPSNF